MEALICSTSLTPPLNKSAEDLRREREASSAAIDLLTEIMLSAPNTPECRKIELRIMRETKRLRDRMDDAFMAFASPIKDLEECEAAYAERKEVLEHIQLMGAGLDSFLAVHPAPVKTNQDT